MANKPITMLQIRRILQLKSHGRSNREIASELHAARDTVNEYVRHLSVKSGEFKKSTFVAFLHDVVLIKIII